MRRASKRESESRSHSVGARPSAGWHGQCYGASKNSASNSPSQWPATISSACQSSSRPPHDRSIGHPAARKVVIDPSRMLSSGPSKPDIAPKIANFSSLLVLNEDVFLPTPHPEQDAPQ